jgi:hypothetical protein
MPVEDSWQETSAWAVSAGRQLQAAHVGLQGLDVMQLEVCRGLALYRVMCVRGKGSRVRATGLLATASMEGRCRGQPLSQNVYM